MRLDRGGDVLDYNVFELSGDKLAKGRVSLSRWYPMSDSFR